MAAAGGLRWERGNRMGLRKLVYRLYERREYLTSFPGLDDSILKSIR